MNLWIILAITWISVSGVIADSSWFVQDVQDEGDSRSAELLSSENLLPVQNKQASTRQVKPHRKPQPRPKTQTNSQQVKVAASTTRAKPASDPAFSDVESEGFLPANPTGRKPLQLNKKDDQLNKQTKDNTLKTNTQEWFVKDSSEESEGKDGLFPSELLIKVYTPKPKRAGPSTSGGVKLSPVRAKPVNVESKVDAAKHADQQFVQATRRKPLQITAPLESSHTPEDKQTPGFTRASPNLVAWFNFAQPEKTITGGDELSEEHYIRVQTATQKALKQQMDTKLFKAETETDQPAAKQPVETAAASKRGEYRLTQTARRKPLQVQGDSSSPREHVHPLTDEPCTDVDCLLKDDDLIMVDKKISSQSGGVQALKTEKDKPQESEIRRESLHRRLLQEGEETERARSSLEVSEELEEVEDLGEDLLWGEDVPLKRFRRADNGTGEESGDGGFDGETDISNSSNTPIPFKTIMNLTKESLTEDEKGNITMNFINQSREEYDKFEGFLDVVVRNVSLDENGRVVIDWELQLSTSAAPGSNQDERIQNTLNFINGTVVPYVNNNLTLQGQPVFVPLDLTLMQSIAESILSDPCKAQDACSEGYICVPAESICRHLCFHNSFQEQCRHGSTCQLNDQFLPYCQCGSGYTGEFCEAPVGEESYSEGQIVGAGAAGAVAAVGTTGLIIYAAVYRKKKEEDMEYSYFGDDDSPMQAYSDPGSNLGITNNFSIARPSIIQHLDLYNEDGAMA